MSVTRWLYLLLAFFVAGLTAFSPALAQVRTSEPINREWRFTLGDPSGAQGADFDDKGWETAHLPHSFSTPYFLGTGFYVGYGWYRKTLDLPQSVAGRQVSLEFDGVFQDAEVFVNGQRAGRHVGGYTGFSVDVTPFVKPGPNLVAVRVNNEWKADVAPRAGEHVFSGGIYRDVRLVVTDPVHVTWYGTYVTTPKVTAKSASVRVRTEVRNGRDKELGVTLISKVYDAKGMLVSQLRTDRGIDAGKMVEFDQSLPEIASPTLWGLKSPYLYKLISEVYVDGRQTDRFETPFGIRTIEWTADKGFFLNGEHVYLVGANVHQDIAGWGDAVTHGAMRRDVQMIKDGGFNFIRGSHYPHSPAFSRATDELGVLFWSEAPFWGIGGFGADGNWLSSAYPPDPKDRPGFEASVLQQSAEMIRIHRNHPSIIAWSNGNETFFSDKGAMDALRAFIKRQVAFMKAQDPSRPVAVGGAQRGEIDKLGDIAGYNGDGATLYLNPGFPSLVSEYGSTIARRPGKFEPGWGHLPEPADQKDRPGPYPWRYPWRAGEAIWAGFDHGSIAAIEFGEMGMIDYARLPKREYYWYRQAYLGLKPPVWPIDGKPAQLSLEASQPVIKGTQGFDDVHLIVKVKDAQGRALSNSPEVTLTIADGPGEFPTGRSITFRNDSLIAIRDGQAAIVFRSHYAGRTKIKATSAGLTPAEVEIVTEGPDPYVEGKSPIVISRPVIDYAPIVKRDQAAEPKNVTTSRPTAASGSAKGHAALLANDGQADTYWRADKPGSGAFWSIDLENIYAIKAIEIDTLPVAAQSIVVEVAPDRVNWTPVATATQSEGAFRFSQFEKPVSGRYLRIRFTGLPKTASATLQDVRVIAIPAE